MKRLRASIADQGLAKTGYFFDPRTDVNIFANKVRSAWARPYVFRLDGISFDRANSKEENLLRNKDIFNGIRNATGLVFQSKFDQKLVETFYAPSSTPNIVIRNGVNLNQFTESGSDKRLLLGIGAEDIVFISSAKWRAHKRLTAIIEVFRRIRMHSKRVCRLIILGEVNQTPLGDVSGIDFVGQVSVQALPDWYRTADICLFFSWLDHCPNSVVEALACKLPVICTNQGGTRELVEATNGGFVVEADEQFKFEPVFLYRPPNPDFEALVEAGLAAIKTYRNIRSNMHLSPIDISIIARRYLEFAGGLINNSLSKK